jgi:hypothetical protein
MKKILFSAFAGLLLAFSTLGTTTSCDKIENSKELASLWALIVESGLQSENDFTPESWAPFAVALQQAESVAGSASPTLEAINTAYSNLHSAFHALVRKTAAGEELPTAA